ncbi:hypothetical protein BJV74DRAFT_794877 [Russula compacta]|nr:hypothetical protein BJV74DRAFT_794877 [Russula compacta]
MLVLASVVSILATLSLASSVGSRRILASRNHWLLQPKSSNSIIAKNFSMKGGGITAYGQNGSIVAVSDGSHTEISVITCTLTNNATAVPSGKEYCRLFNSGFEGAQFPDEPIILVHGENRNFALCHLLHEAPILTMM